MANTILVTPGQAVAPDDWNALLIQHGNLPANAQPQIIPLDDPLLEPLLSRPGMAAYLQQHPAYRYYLADGSSVVAFGMENGQDVQVLEYKPSPKFTQAQKPPSGGRPADATPRIEGTPIGGGAFDNTQPIMVWRTPDGQQAGPAEPLQSHQRDQWERDKNRAAGVGPYTDKEVADAGRKQQPSTVQHAVPGYPGWTMATTKDGNNNELTVYYPPGSTTAQPSLPAKPDEPKAPSFQTVPGGDGQTYIRSIAVGPNGVPVITNYGPNGQKVDTIPGEREKPVVRQQEGSDGQTYNIVTTMDASGIPRTVIRNANGDIVPAVPGKADKTEIRVIDGEEREIIRDPKTGQVVSTRPLPGQQGSGSGGPSMPQLVVGAASEALRQYHNALKNDPSLTPAQRERRFQEAVQVGTMAANEARIVDAENQSVRGYNFNVADAKLNYYQRGLGQALDFVSKFNGLLPEGSDLGGKALGALLGIQMLQMNASGINQLNPGGVPTRSRYEGGAGAPGTPAVPRAPTPAELNDPAALEARRQEILAHPAFTATNTIDANGQPRVMTPSVPGNAPAQPLPVRNGVPVTSTPAVPPAAASAPAAPPPPRDPVLTSPLQAPGAGAPLRVRDPWGNEFEMTQQQMDARPGGSKDLTVIGPAATPVAAPVVPPPAAPVPQPQSAPVSMTPPGPEFAVLNRAIQPAAAPQVETPQPPAFDFSQSPALLRTRAQMTVPWRLDPLEIQQMIDAGVPEEDIWSTPTRAFA